MDGLAQTERGQAMTRRFRLALIGAGQITTQSHLPSALALPEIEVAGIVDASAERAAALARSYGLTVPTGTTLDSLGQGIQGAVVATPNATHRDVAVACLDRGIHVLIEKPVAATYADARAIADLAAARGLVAAVGYVTRFRDNVRLLKRLLSEEYFGSVRRFVHQFGTVGGWAPLSGYNLDAKSAGGGVLMVTGTHFIDRMLYLWGYPDEIAYWDDAVDGPEANCVGRFRFHGLSGVLEGTVRYSKMAALPGALVLDAARGRVTLADNDDAEIELRPHARPELAEVIRGEVADLLRASEAFRTQLRDFVAACRGERKPECDAEMAAQSIRLIEAMYATRALLDQRWYEPAPRIAS